MSDLIYLDIHKIIKEADMPTMPLSLFVHLEFFGFWYQSLTCHANEAAQKNRMRKEKMTKCFF